MACTVKVIVSTVFAAVCGVALGNPPGPQANANAGAVGVGVGIGVAGAESRASASALNLNSSHSNAGGGAGYGGAGGSISASSFLGNSAGILSGNSAGNTQTVNLGGVPAQQTITHNGRSQLVTAPPIYLAPAIPTASCLNGVSLGGSGMGGGGGLGFYWEMENCRRQEVSKQFEAMGLRDDALSVLCQIEHAKAAPSCAKYTPPAQAAEKQAAVWNGGEHQ